jgi:hypothetical protein
MDIHRNSIGLVKHNEIQQLATKKDHHTGRPLVVTLPIEVRRTTPLNVCHLRIQDLSNSPRIRQQALIPVEGSDSDKRGGSEWEPVKILLKEPGLYPRQIPVTHEQWIESHTNRQDNKVMEQPQVLGTIP